MEIIPKQLNDILHLVANTMGVANGEFENGLEELNFGLMRLALEASHAESLGIGLSTAVNQPEKFQLMNTFHHGVKDILALEVPAEMLPLAEKTLEVVSKKAPIESIRFALAKAACMLPKNSPQRALARFALFEAVRLNLLVASHDDRPALAYADVGDDELSKIAEKQVQQLIEAREEFFESQKEPLRPLDMIVGAGLHDLLKKVEVFAKGEAVSDYIRNACETRADLEKKLNQLPPMDELLLRNSCAVEFGEQKHSYSRLAKMHPLVFQNPLSQNTLDQRLSRARKRLMRGSTVQERKTGQMTMIEFFTSVEGEQ